MKKLMITGASGFIGSAVVNSLKNQDYELHTVYHDRPCTNQPEVIRHRINLLETGEVTELFARVKPTHLIQLAWCTGQGTYWSDHANLNWLTANLEIARQFAKNGGRRCVFGGTSAEYDWSTPTPLNETSTPLKPLLLYGGTKLAAYWALTRFFEQEKVSFAWARFFNPFGEGENRKRLIPKTCLSLLRNETLNFDSATSLRDFLHIDDVANAVVALLQSSAEGAVNIASGFPVTIREVISTIAVIYGRSNQVKFDDSEVTVNLNDAVIADTKKLAIECGWNPSSSFRERMVQTCEWWQHQYLKQPTSK